MTSQLTRPLLPDLILASQSPRREQLLTSLGIPFTVENPDAEEESASAARAREITSLNALKKAKSVLPRLKDPSGIIIGADTLVVFGNEAIGKPKDARGVHSILRKLSGMTHEVVTGLTLLSPRFGCRESVVTSRVSFKVITDKEIEDYSVTKEPYDKAGAYAVQGLGMLFINRIEGSYTNVMGLPLETFLRELQALTEIPIHHWFLPERVGRGLA